MGIIKKIHPCIFECAKIYFTRNSVLITKPWDTLTRVMFPPNVHWWANKFYITLVVDYDFNITHYWDLSISSQTSIFVIVQNTPVAWLCPTNEIKLDGKRYQIILSCSPNWLLQVNISPLILRTNQTHPYNHKRYKMRQTVTFQVKMHWIYVSTNRSTWTLKSQTCHENVWIKYLRCFHINS